MSIKRCLHEYRRLFLRKYKKFHIRYTKSTTKIEEREEEKMSDFAYLKTLNKGQYEAATTIHGPVRILAGAGSGKTHTLISRVAYMVDSGIPPEQILLLTFTNNAAKNMVKRAAALSNPACSKITACTYHSFCAKLLRVSPLRRSLEVFSF